MQQDIQGLPQEVSISHGEFFTNGWAVANTRPTAAKNTATFMAYRPTIARAKLVSRDRRHNTQNYVCIKRGLAIPPIITNLYKNLLIC